MANPSPKISLVEVLLVLPYILLLDVVGIVVVLFGLDDVWILDLLAAPVLFYVWIKGVGLTRYAVMAALEVIPYVGALPLQTIGFLMVVYLDRHPQAEAAFMKVAGKLKGGLATKAGAAGKAAKISEQTEKLSEKEGRMVKKAAPSTGKTGDEKNGSLEQKDPYKELEKTMTAVGREDLPSEYARPREGIAVWDRVEPEPIKIEDIKTRTVDKDGSEEIL